MCRRNSTEMKVCPVMCTVNMQQGDKERRKREKEREGAEQIGLSDLRCGD